MTGIHAIFQCSHYLQRLNILKLSSVATQKNFLCNEVLHLGAYVTYYFIMGLQLFEVA